MTDKPEVHHVFVQVTRPSASYPAGVAAEGAYTVSNNTVTLTDRQGNPVRDGNGKLYSKPIENGDTARQVAARLTKQMRSSLRGKDNRVNGFDRPLQYPKVKWV